jgi:hypothetical protein
MVEVDCQRIFSVLPQTSAAAVLGAAGHFSPVSCSSHEPLGCAQHQREREGRSEVSGEINGTGHEHQWDGHVVEVVRSVERDMQGQQASIVYEILNMCRTRGQPSVVVNDELLGDAAARTAVGVRGL